MELVVPPYRTSHSLGLLPRPHPSNKAVSGENKTVSGVEAKALPA